MFSCEAVHYGKGLTPAFGKFFASANKIFILAGGLATGRWLIIPIILWNLGTFLIFPNFLRFFFSCVGYEGRSAANRVVRQLARQLVYTMSISNNHPSFHLWWKENLVKHQKVSKHYENICLPFFFCFLRLY